MDTIRPIAYFCSEFALSSELPTYAGGLGILAGDMIRQAADEGAAFVGVGLYYPEGYLCQKMLKDGRVVEECPIIHPDQVGLKKVTDTNGNDIVVTLPIGQDTIIVSAWEWREKNVRVFFLDTHVKENTEENQLITNRLYTKDRITRLKQQLVLGIGGVRFLEKMGIHPSLYHMNEGHSAFLFLDLIRHEMEEHHLEVDEAKKRAKTRVVFTNHTLVAAGDETYSIDVITQLLSTYAEEIQLPLDEIIAMGRVDSLQTFSMTHFAFRSSTKANCVSTLHLEKAKDIWPDYDMTSVTNGVHQSTWQKPLTHQENKRALLSFIKEETGIAIEESTLLLGWARRMVSYKRPLAMLDDQVRLAQIIQQAGKNARIVLSGFAPPGDEHAEEMFKKLEEMINGPLKEYVIYLPNYTMNLASLLVSGCDVWVNTPVVGFEACGTSGMKALLNGVLPLTTNDGWVAEVDLTDIGWVVDSADVTNSFLDILEQHVIPTYYEHPEVWGNMMQKGKELAEKQYTTTRMFHDYQEKLYKSI